MNPFIPTSVNDLLSKPISYYQENQSEVSQGKAPLTNVALILDCSGSMLRCREVTIEGFNAQVDVIRAGAREAGATTYTDVQFSTDVNIRSIAGDLDHLMPLTNETYQPGGSTALLDAIGQPSPLFCRPRISIAQTLPRLSQHLPMAKRMPPGFMTLKP